MRTRLFTLTALLVIFTALYAPTAFAQKINEGLWNAGRASAPVLGSDSLRVQQLLAKVQLYPGFAVVRTELVVLNPFKDTLTASLRFADTASTPHPFFQRISSLPSAGRVLIMGRDTLDPLAPIRFAPGTGSLAVLEICPTHQAILSRSGSVKEANAFVYTPNPDPQTPSRILVELKTGLTLTNIMGVYPDSVLSTMTQLSLTLGKGYFPKGGLLESTPFQELVIWYNGAAPDVKFEKKVLPLKQQLYEEMNGFNMGMFSSPEFRPHQLHDFSTNKRSPFISFLYFLMFSAPWILMIGFLVWLAFKPKKKKQAS